MPRKTRKNGIRGAEKRALQDEFLRAYEAIATISGAAKQLGINRSTHYGWLDEDDAYAARFEQSDQAATDRLEQEARRRAIAGVDEPVFYKGEQVGAVRKYSDVLLIFLLKGKRPHIYRDTVDHRVSGNEQKPLVIDLVTDRRGLEAARDDQQ